MNASLPNTGRVFENARKKIPEKLSFGFRNHVRLRTHGRPSGSIRHENHVLVVPPRSNGRIIIIEQTAYGIYYFEPRRGLNYTVPKYYYTTIIRLSDVCVYIHINEIRRAVNGIS